MTPSHHPLHIVTMSRHNKYLVAPGAYNNEPVPQYASVPLDNAQVTSIADIDSFSRHQPSYPTRTYQTSNAPHRQQRPAYASAYYPQPSSYPATNRFAGTVNNGQIYVTTACLLWLTMSYVAHSDVRGMKDPPFHAAGGVQESDAGCCGNICVIF